jgi:hypothetical protein
MRVIMWKQCPLDVSHRVTPKMQSQSRGPTRPLGYHPISDLKPLLDSHRTVEVQIRLGVNPPIVEATFDNDDPKQPSTCLAERGR